VATIRTETEAAIIFSTDRDRTFTPARICAFAASWSVDRTPADLTPSQQDLENLPRTPLFGDPQPQTETGFYLAIDSETRSLQGHLIPNQFMIATLLDPRRLKARLQEQSLPPQAVGEVSSSPRRRASFL
jgi:hypothetical protein